MLKNTNKFSELSENYDNLDVEYTAADDESEVLSSLLQGNNDVYFSRNSYD